MLYFLVSYGHGDDALVREFFGELEHEVRRQAEKLPAGAEVGFLDQSSVEAGEHWPTSLTSALAHCRVFLALFSPDYFRSEICAQEWELYLRRVRQQQALTGDPVRGLVPLIWRMPRALPAAVRDLQYPRAAFGRAYAEHPLMRLYRSGRHRRNRLEFVEALATLIVKIAEEDAPLVEGATGLDPREVPALWPVAEVPPALDRLHLVIASAPRNEMEAVRDQCEFYRDRPREWSPYRTAMQEDVVAPPLADVVAAVTRNTWSVTEATESGLEPRLDQARRDNEVVMLLADPWAPRIPDQRDRLVSFDGPDRDSWVLLVPFAKIDQETSAHGAELSAELVAAMPRAHRRQKLLRDDLGTVVDFRRTLSSELAEAVSAIRRYGEPHRYPDQDEEGEAS